MIKDKSNVVRITTTKRITETNYYEEYSTFVDVDQISPPGAHIVSKSLSQNLSSGAKFWLSGFQQVGFPSQGTASIITMPKERLAATEASL